MRRVRVDQVIVMTMEMQSLFEYRPTLSDDMYLRKAREELKKWKTNLNRKSYDVMNFRNNNHLKFPLLAPIARKWLCALATSVSSERCFSTSGNVVTKKRAALGSNRIGDIIFILDNFDKLH